MDCIGMMTVVGGSLLSVERRDACTDLNELVDTLLFSQLAANLKVGKFDAPGQWFSHYLKAMSMSGWTSSGQYLSQFESGERTSITLQQLIKTTLSDRLSNAHADALDSMMVTVGSLPESDTAQCLFRQYVLKPTSEKMGADRSESVVSRLALEVSLLEQRAILHSLFVTFDTAAHVEADMFSQVFASHEIASAIDLRYYRHEWNIAGYSKVRPNVEAFLKGKKKGLILPIIRGA